MDKIRIGLCDEEATVVEILKKQMEAVLKETKADFEIQTFRSGESIYKKAEDLSLVFLGMKMKRMDGISLGKKLKEKNRKCRVILMTKNLERMKDAVRIKVFRLISKPVRKEEIEEAIFGFLEEKAGEKKLAVYQNRIQYEIEQREITYLLAYGSYIEVITRSGVFRKDISLSRIEKQLDDRLFFRIHRKYIINLEKIAAYRNGNLRIGEQVIQVSRRKKKEFEKKYLEFEQMTV